VIDVTLIGFGTVGKVVQDLFLNEQEFNFDAIVVSEGFEDTIPKEFVNKVISWDTFKNGKPRNYFVCVGYQDLNTRRQELFDFALRHGHSPLSFVHEKAFVSKSARVGKGVIVMPGVTLENNSEIGDGTFVWSGTVAGHDSIIGAFSFISANVSIGGGAKLGDNCVVGLGATIGNRVLVGDRSLLGAGTLTTHSIASESVLVRVDEKPLDWPSHEFLKLTNFDQGDKS
jgi:sugar O-acyltransferase (sialic acid O-acetyltransferase NeuD family)